MNDYKKLFYDFEVFKEDWLVVLIDYDTRKKSVIINDVEKLRDVYEKATKANYIWVGYNSRNYDAVILKSILLGNNPYETNNKIIVQELKEHQILGEDKHKFPLLNFDVSNKLNSLKQLEGFMGSKIKESDIDFNINRKLTQEEIEETVEYCTHDVEQTIEVFENKREEFDSQASLIEAFDLPLEDFNRTKAQLVSKILNANRNEYNDEFELIFPDTLILDKYQYIYDWFKDPKNHNTSKALYTEIAGIPHTVGWGGLHGSDDNISYIGNILCADVASLYPSIMIEYGLLSRNVENSDLYRQIRDTRLKLKKEKNPMQQPYKIVLNSTYGASGDKYNPLYDIRMCRCVCVCGQLLLIDLIEKIEPYCTLLQSNTDGVYLSFEDESNIPIVEELMHEWERRVRLDLEIEFANGIYQKDVNNYILLEGDHYKSKGAYIKKLSKIDYDLPIVNKALINYFTENKPLEDTINECDNLIDFQKIVKVSRLYSYALHGETKIKEKVLRVFASKDESAQGIFKVKGEDKIEKIGNTPEKCFIYNENVIDVKVPPQLDKQYYIDMAYKRLSDFLDKKVKGHKEKNEISGISNEILREVFKIKEDITKYTTFFHILKIFDELNCNKSQLDILIKLDYFSEFGHIHQLLSQVKVYAELSALYEKFKTCKQLNKSDLILPLDEVMECCGKATEKQLREIDNDKLVKVFRKHYPSILKQISDKYPYQPTTISDKIKYEVEKLGYTSLIDESADWNNYALLSTETNQWGNTFYNLYHIQTGITKSVKLDKKRCYIAKVEVGDVLLCVFDVKKKWKMVDGKMTQIDEVEELLISYAIKD